MAYEEFGKKHERENIITRFKTLRDDLIKIAMKYKVKDIEELDEKLDRPTGRRSMIKKDVDALFNNFLENIGCSADVLNSFLDEERKTADRIGLFLVKYIRKIGQGTD